MEKEKWIKIFKAIKNEFIIDGWDDLSDDEQRDQVKSLLSGMGIVFSLQGGFLLTNYFIGKNLENATDELINFVNSQSVDYFDGMSDVEIRNIIVDNLFDDEENFDVLVRKLLVDPDFLDSVDAKEVFFDEKTFNALQEMGRHLVCVKELEEQGVVYDVNKWVSNV